MLQELQKMMKRCERAGGKEVHIAKVRQAPHIRHNNNNSTQDCVEEYMRVLYHLSVLYDPETFMGILPANGNMSFFLPFIEAAFHHYKSHSLKQAISGGLGSEGGSS